ncbi:MAG: hypothetical protein PVJ49_08735 [Acidobacteriota bacterium]
MSLPCTLDAAPLLLGFIEELMEVSGGEASEPDRLEHDLRQAVDAICNHAAGDERCSVVAVFEIHDRGVDVRLTCENQAAADIGMVEQVIAAREA